MVFSFCLLLIMDILYGNASAHCLHILDSVNDRALRFITTSGSLTRHLTHMGQTHTKERYGIEMHREHLVAFSFTLSRAGVSLIPFLLLCTVITHCNMLKVLRNMFIKMFKIKCFYFTCGPPINFLF